MTFARLTIVLQRGLAAGLVGLCLAQQSAACLAQEPTPAEQAEAPAKEQADLATMVCPVYPFMDFGSYVSYYALLDPDCTQGVSYDGPQQVPADCAGHMGCVPLAFTERTSGLWNRHHTHPDMEKDGIDPPYREQIESSIATELNPTVKFIEFPKNGQSGPMVRAKVWFFKVEPAMQPARYVGVGHEVAAGAVHRKFSEDEVVVADRSMGKEKRASVLVLIDRDRQIWRPYNILLLK